MSKLFMWIIKFDNILRGYGIGVVRDAVRLYELLVDVQEFTDSNKKNDRTGIQKAEYNLVLE